MRKEEKYYLMIEPKWVQTHILGTWSSSYIFGWRWTSFGRMSNVVKLKCMASFFRIKNGQIWSLSGLVVNLLTADKGSNSSIKWITSERDLTKTRIVLCKNCIFIRRRQCFMQQSSKAHIGNAIEPWRRRGTTYPLILLFSTRKFVTMWRIRETFKLDRR